MWSKYIEIYGKFSIEQIVDIIFDKSIITYTTLIYRKGDSKLSATEDRQHYYYG